MEEIHLIHINPPLLNGALVSLPYCDAAGVIADSKKVELALVKYAARITMDKGIKKISMRSTSPLTGFNNDKTLNSQKVRMVLKLPKDSETLLGSFKAKLRSQVNKPIKDGLSSHMGGLELAASVIMKMPVCVSRALGNMTRRYIPL